MMDPQMTNKLSKDGHRKEHHMSTMRDRRHGMMMDPHMMQMMMGHHQADQHQHHNMSPMGEGMGGMMDPEMMQKRQQHMSNMEQRLANIEALLTKLVELQKP
jgi:hypothetical protein